MVDLFSFSKSLPDGWECRTLKSVSSYISDGSHFSPKIENNGKHYVTVSDVYSDEIHVESSSYISIDSFKELVNNGCQPKIGDILLSKDGTVGRTAIVHDTNDFVVLSSLGIIRPTKLVQSKFIKYVLDSDILQEQMKAEMAGSALRRITIRKITILQIPVPPLHVQSHIVSYLDTKTKAIDKKVELLTKKRDAYLRLKKSIIKHAVTKGLNHDEKYVDSGIEWIGEIPERWKIAEIKSYCKSIFAGATPSTNESSYWDGDIPWIPSGSCHDGLIVDYCKTITKEGYQNSSTKLIKPNTTLLAMTGATCGNTGYLTFSSCANQSVCAYIENESLCYSKFLFYLLQSAKSYILTFQTGGAQAGINIQDCSNLKVPFVTLSEQQSISDYLDDKCSKIDAIVTNINTQIKKYELLKRALINEVVTGRRAV